MSEAEIYLDGVRFISTRAASKLSGLSQNYVSKICKSGFANARIIRGIWYVDELSLSEFLKQQAEERDKWHKRLSQERLHERLSSDSIAHVSPKKHYPTGASAITVHPRELHKYHSARRAKKKLQKSMTLAATSALIMVLTLSQLQIKTGLVSTQVAAAGNAFVSLESTISSFGKPDINEPKIIYVGVVSPTIVSSIDQNGNDTSGIERDTGTDNQMNVYLATNVEISSSDLLPKSKIYAHKILLTQSASSTDIQTFASKAEFGNTMDNLVILLTPSVKASMYYALNPADSSITIYSSAAGTASLFISAPKRAKQVAKFTETSTTTTTIVAIDASSTSTSTESLDKSIH